MERFNVQKQFSLNEGLVRSIKKNETAIRKAVVTGTKLSDITSLYTRDVITTKIKMALILWLKDYY